MSYVRPIASTKHVEAIRALYRDRYAVSLSFEEAKQLLEGVMQLVYLTEVLARLDPEVIPKQSEKIVPTSSL